MAGGKKQDVRLAWAQLFPGHVVKVVDYGAAKMTYDEPEYCFEHSPECWRHAAIPLL